MRISTISILFLISIASLFSQETGKVENNEDNALKYDVSFSMDELVYHNYRITENTRVKRVFEDSTVNEYSKDVTHWFTVFVPEKVDKNGFLLTEVQVDSMTYDLKSPAINVSYDSRNFDMEIPINNMDFFNSYIVNSLTFKFLYSPYGNVSKVSGKRLEDARQNFAKTTDTLKRNQIIQEVGDGNLEFLFDVAKGVYPPFAATIDTSWKSEITYYISHIPVSGEVTNTFKGYSDQEYQIMTKVDSLELRNKIADYLFPDLDKYGSVNSATTSGTIETDMYTGGTIKYVRALLKTKISGKLANFKYNETIETTYTWDLLGRFAYK